MYLSNQSFNIHLPREFDYQSLPRGGEFDPHALGVENLNCTLCEISGVASYHRGRGVRGFPWKDCAVFEGI